MEITHKVVDLDEAEKRLVSRSEEVEIAQVGVWRVAGGRRTRCVDVVLLSKEVIGKENVDQMVEAVGKLRTLFQASGRECGVAGKVCGVHSGKKVLWTISNIKVGVDANVVKDALVTNVRALWGGDACINAWVERKLSWYDRIDNISEED